MTALYIIIFGLLGAWLGYTLAKRNKTKLNTYNQKQIQEKEEKKNKILELFKTQDRITNNDIEKLLGVSDASATRYLDELEKEGKIIQKGENRGVYYIKNGSTSG